MDETTEAQVFEYDRKGRAFDRLMDLMEPDDFLYWIKMAAGMEDDDLLSLLVNYKADILQQTLVTLRDDGRILAVGGGVLRSNQEEEEGDDGTG